MRTDLAALVVALAASACAAPLGAAPAALPRAPGGSLVLVGGGAKPPEAMARFVALAGGAQARIVVLPLATGESREAGADYVDLFRGLGVADVDVVHLDDRRDASRPAYVAAIAHATGVWFSGGDQRRIAARLVDTPALDAIRAMKAAGGVVGGTSAGTACESGVMLTGEGDWRPGGLVLTRGLDLAPGVLMDTHFVVRHRQRRLRAAVLDHPDRVGVGVDEGTAVVIAPDGSFEVLGRGAVLVYDAAGARDMDAVRETRLVAGQRYSVPQRAVQP